MKMHPFDAFWVQTHFCKCTCITKHCFIIFPLYDQRYGQRYFNKIVLNLQSPDPPVCSKKILTSSRLLNIYLTSSLPFIPPPPPFFWCLGTVSVCQSSCDASLYQFPFYIVQDVFNLLPNLNVADLIKAFAGKWIKGANFCVSFIIFHSLLYHISIMCSENKWYDVGYLSFVSRPKCSRSPQLDQQQGEITFFFFLSESSHKLLILV
jgi:hypothetical protein